LDDDGVEVENVQPRGNNQPGWPAADTGARGEAGEC
jgi:hypothetical protein